MPKRIEFEGVVHEFPDDFTDADIAAALGGGAPPAESPPLPTFATSRSMIPPSTVAEGDPDLDRLRPLHPVAEFAGGVLDSIGNAAQGAGELALSTGRAMYESQPSEIARRVAAGEGVVGEDMTALGQTILGLPMGLLEGVVETAGDVVSGDPRRMGEATGNIGLTVAGARTPTGRAVTGGTRRVALNTGARTLEAAARRPAMTATVGGAMPGIVAGNPLAAMAGGLYGFERAPVIARRLSSTARRLRESAPRAAARRSAARPASFTDDVAGRIDWQSQPYSEAVPIDALRNPSARSIIEPGESFRGLLRRLNAARKAKNATEVDRLTRALAQRISIDDKVRGLRPAGR